MHCSNYHAFIGMSEAVRTLKVLLDSFGCLDWVACASFITLYISKSVSVAILEHTG